MERHNTATLVPALIPNHVPAAFGLSGLLPDK
jgi:hypothetical protein